MNVRVVRDQTKVTAFVRGRVDSESAREFHEALAAIPGDGRSLTIDLSATDLLTSAAIRALIICRKRFPGSAFRVVGANEIVLSVIRMCGLVEMLNCEVAEASHDERRMTFRSFLANKVAERPDAISLSTESQTYSWRDLNEASNVMAERLYLQRVAFGDHVGLCAVNSVDWVVAFFAIQKMGAMAMLINPKLQAAEIVALRERADIRVLCTDRTDELGERVVDIRGATDRNKDTSRAIWAPELGDADDPSVVIFTSGSTGRPKGVMLSAYNVFCGARRFVGPMRITANDIGCQTLPFFHIYGLVAGLFAFLLNDAQVCVPADVHTADVLQAIERRRCTVMAAVPSVALAVFTKEVVPAERVRSLRLVQMGGAAIGNGQFRRLLSAVPAECRLQVIYGMSELLPISMTRLDGSPEIVMTTVGRIVEGVEVKIAPNGEVLARGDSLMAGYYKTAVEDQSFDDDGWLHTGDLGRVDSEGNLHLTGRIKDLIIRGGENIMPDEIADAISAVSGIADVKVFGMPDEFWGEIVVAAVVMASGETFDEVAVRDDLASRIAKYKIPTKFLVLDELPRLANGKVDAKALRKLA